jgi:DNA/RNA-binding domain of Phe-tRNA-synthetase-like protein
VEPRLVLIKRPPTGWPSISDEELNNRLSAIRSTATLEQLRDQPDIAAYRQFYWRLGIDPTKRRPSAEALVRRIIADKPFPRINPIVDRYNLISAENRISLGALSTDHLAEQKLTMRMAQPQEPFLGIGFPEPKPCTGQELVLSVAGEIIALYPYRDSHKTRIRGDDSAVLFTLCSVPGIENERLVATEKSLLEEFS